MKYHRDLTNNDNKQSQMTAILVLDNNESSKFYVQKTDFTHRFKKLLEKNTSCS